MMSIEIDRYGSEADLSQDYFVSSLHYPLLLL